MSKPVGFPNGIVTRRDFLRIGAAGAVTVAAGGMLASRVRAQAAPVQSPLVGCEPGGPLNLFTWQGYEGTGVSAMDDFWANSGIDLNMRPLGNENLLQVMKSPGAEQWDAFSVNQGDNNYFHSQGILSPIHVDEVPALGEMYPAIADNPIWKIEDGVYNGVPWTIGALGINWLASKFPEGVHQYAMALDPAYRVGCFDDKLNMVATAACAVGLDPAVLTREELNGPVRDWLLALRPQLKVISASLGDQLTVLINGEVDFQLVGLSWNIPLGVEQGVEIGWTIPDEGSYGFVDSIGITPWAPNRCNALAYANATMTPETAAPLNDSVVGIGPTAAINAALDPSVRSLYPDDIEADLLGKLKWNVSHFDPDGPYATIDEWDAVWTEAKLAG
ncbi:MAG: hypothetical protein KF809_17110 [Chloroflexi bacterium]|nr:hypothetical protein [Chloroflexota bacterium]